MKLLVGIDDTDNKESRGTGYRSRKLGALIESKGLGRVVSISRHQLFVNPQIPYTSQNSSACLLVDIDNKYIEEIKVLCREFLLEDSAEGSDVGLCIHPREEVVDEIINWGLEAKKTVLTKGAAYSLAEKNNVFLEGLTGTYDGIIGAMAAIGLRKHGGDGRCIWLQGKELRDLKGFMSAKEIRELTGIEEILTIDLEPIHEEVLIDLGEWVRPIIKNNKPTIIVEEVINNERINWKCVSKEYIKSISD